MIRRVPMNKTFLALVCALVVLLGCGGPLQRYQCTGGLSGATQWHTVEGLSPESAREANGFGECRVAQSEPVESVVGEEYAGATTTSRKRCAAMIAIHAVWLETAHMGYQSLEVFRGRGPTMTDASADAFTGFNAWRYRSKGKLKSFDEVAHGGRASDEDGPADIVRCWTGSDPPTDVKEWPNDGSYAFGAYERWRDMSWWQKVRGLESYTRGENCLEYTSTGWTWRAATNNSRFQNCNFEMHGREQITTSSGWEMGSSFVLRKFESHICGPATAAQSYVERSLRDRAPPNWQLDGYAGACWPMHTPKPEQPTRWTGKDGAW